ncbi:hypothetical protein [Nonlabens agnitus]|uniref:hypothetical protein n=1 Tax=Nonlabens agnitus TaxID=870484 RepID=UPI0015599A62|nr:hypothetical protein [Nonlabens agnitus]
MIEKDIGGDRPIENDPKKQKSWNVWKPDRPHQMPEEPVTPSSEQPEFRKTVEENVAQEKSEQPLDDWRQRTIDDRCIMYRAS